MRAFENQLWLVSSDQTVPEGGGVTRIVHPSGVVLRELRGGEERMVVAYGLDIMGEIFKARALSLWHRPNDNYMKDRMTRAYKPIAMDPLEFEEWEENS